MCDPLSATAAAFTVGSGLLQAKSQRQAANYDASIAEQNAQLADMTARDAIGRGESQAQDYRAQTQQVIGRQRTALAAGNIDPSSGSAVDLLTDTAMIGELDAQRIRANAAREAFGYRTQGTSYRAQAAQTRYAGQQAAQGTILGAAGQTFGIARRGGMI